jgi:hypothetical protein
LKQALIKHTEYPSYPNLNISRCNKIAVIDMMLVFAAMRIVMFVIDKSATPYPGTKITRQNEKQ